MIRRTKVLFMRWNLHKIFHPFTGFLLNLAYMAKLSKWRRAHRGHELNDFYARKWDYQKRYSLYSELVKAEALHGAINYLEFGVAKGTSIKWWVEQNTNESSKFFGFDTFTGLPEDWNLMKAGSMSAEGETPKLEDERVQFLKGLFQETLPGFLKGFDNSRRAVIHMDADLYTSTLFVLTSLAPFLKANDILIFDEFAVPRHEFLAFTNFVDAYRVQYEVIGSLNNYYFLAVKIKSQSTTETGR